MGGTRRQLLNFVSDVRPVDFSVIVCSLVVRGGKPPQRPISDSLEDKAQLLRTTTGLRVETATTARDPEAFIERISGHGQRNLLIVATREQALYGAEKFLRHRNVPVLLLANL